MKASQGKQSTCEKVKQELRVQTYELRVQIHELGG